MSIQEIQDEMVDEFALFENWADKYEYLIDQGKSLPPMPEAYRTENNLIRGCQSQVWLHTFSEGGNVRFQAYSDAIITRGMIALLLRIFDNRTPSEITAAPVTFHEATGLAQHLSMTRANGLLSMIQRIKSEALALQATP